MKQLQVSQLCSKVLIFSIPSTKSNIGGLLAESKIKLKTYQTFVIHANILCFWKLTFKMSYSSGKMKITLVWPEETCQRNKSFISTGLKHHYLWLPKWNDTEEEEWFPLIFELANPGDFKMGGESMESLFGAEELKDVDLVSEVLLPIVTWRRFNSVKPPPRPVK